MKIFELVIHYAYTGEAEKVEEYYCNSFASCLRAAEQLYNSYSEYDPDLEFELHIQTINVLCLDTPETNDNKGFIPVQSGKPA